jgi:DNA polymerase (family 10)
MTNSEIVEKLEDAMACMEVLELNVFKINAFRNLSQHIEKLGEQLNQLEESRLDGMFTKGMRLVVKQLLETGSFAELDQLEAEIPAGVRSMLQISGLGPKKVRNLWKEAGIEDLETLQHFCETGKLVQIKGFGEKVQHSILEGIGFLKSVEGKWLMHKGKALGNQILEELKARGITILELVGDLATRAETVSAIEFLLPSSEKNKLKSILQKHEDWEWLPAKSSPFHFEARIKKNQGILRFFIANEENWTKTRYMLNTNQSHWDKATQQKIPLYKTWLKGNYTSEKQLFELLERPFIPEELRLGTFEWNEDFDEKKSKLISYSDLSGCLHNHSNYSDGKHTLLQMAEACIQRGWKYFGIADHSKSAQYANGLFEERVEAQWKEIEALNKNWTDFRILKGIESDIMADGSLDYESDFLKGFDYVVASVHSSMKMDKETATQRLIRAIENPYTSILGHCSGRILLRRPGYPLHYQKIIDACIANGVVIEINAHPSRLDMDWENLSIALEKGALISINPDAHEMEGMDLMAYGTWMARKAGAEKHQVLNAFSLPEIISFLKKKNPVLA